MGLLIVHVIKSYKASAFNPCIFQREDIAGAEPVVPGWRMAVDELFGAVPSTIQPLSTDCVLCMTVLAPRISPTYTKAGFWALTYASIWC